MTSPGHQGRRFCGSCPGSLDPAPEKRTPGLIAQVRSECDHSRTARSDIRVVCARLAITCADFAAIHERLAQSMPHKAFRLLAISQAARDKATAYRRLAMNAA